MTHVRKVSIVDGRLMAAFERLLPQLTKAPMPTAEHIAALVDSESALFALEQNGEIVGLGALCIFISPSGRHGHIEDVVVDQSQRGKGYGEQIVQALIEEARSKGLPGVSLTCNPRRQEANRLYTRMGFKQWQTNNYWLDLND